MAANGADVPVPECVRRALNGVTDARGWKDARFHIEAGSNDGDGYMSTLYRIVIRNEGESIFLICKTALAAMEKSSFVENAFKAESFMYNRVLPAMEEIAHLGNPLPWPRAYPTDQQYCVLMEDLRPDGFVISEKGVVLDEKRCRLVVSQLAKFHGAGLALDTLRPDLMTEFKNIVNNPSVLDEMRKVYEPFLKSSVHVPSMIADRFPEGSPVYEKLQNLCASYVDAFFEFMLPDPEGGNSIAHADFHVNNILFQQNKAGEWVSCRIIDFQTVRFASPAADLAVILLTTTEKATRDEHWDALIRAYHDELQSTLRAAGIQDPDTVYSWNQFLRQLKNVAPIAACMVPIMVYMYSDECDVKEVQEALVQATDEDPENSSNASVQFKVTPLMRRRLGDVVENLIEWGYL